MLLSISLKMELLRALLTGTALTPVLEPLPPTDLLLVHRFVWEKTLEFGIKMQGRHFPQDEIQARLRSLSQAQFSRGCPAKLKNCQLQECYMQQPGCMRAMALQQIEAMGSAVQEFLIIQ